MRPASQDRGMALSDPKSLMNAAFVGAKTVRSTVGESKVSARSQRTTSLVRMEREDVFEARAASVCLPAATEVSEAAPVEVMSAFGSAMN